MPSTKYRKEFKQPQGCTVDALIDRLTKIKEKFGGEIIVCKYDNSTGERFRVDEIEVIKDRHLDRSVYYTVVLY